MLNDIALIHLSEPLIFNRWVWPICILDIDPVPGSLCLTAGWGAIKERGHDGN